MVSFHQDTEEEIQKCLHCTYKECINCLGPKGSDKVRGKMAKKHEEWTVRIRELAHLGLSDRQIASRLGLSPKTVLTLRHAAGIPSKCLYVYEQKKFEKEVTANGVRT